MSVIFKGLAHANLGNFDLNVIGRARFFHLQNYGQITTENGFLAV